MSTKLSSYIKEQIAKDLLRHKFRAEVKALLKKQAEFAEELYRHFFPEDVEQKMRDLPKGWLRYDNYFYLKFGNSGYHSFSVYFNGESSIGKHTRKIISDQKHKDAPTKPFPHSFDANIPLGHELNKKNAALERERDALEEKIKHAELTLESTMNGSTTVGALIKKWPEVEPFARKYDTGDPQLPAPPYTTLNNMFGLPVGA